MAFREVRIGDYFRFSKGLGYLGKYLESSNVGLIGLNSFEAGGGYKFGGEKPYSGPYKEQHRAHPGDLFIATTDITQDGRVLGSPFLLPYDISDYESFIFSGDIVKGEPITQEFTAEYLFNILRVKNVREKIAYASTGTTVRRVPVDVVENVWVSIPTPAIQRIICLILSSIDEKIRVNQQIATTLEQIAQTIFKSWFVNFDPVHAKMRGEQPEGMDAEIAALFPDSFEDCEIGPIPAGWQVSRIDEVSKVMLGGTPSKSKPDYWDGDVAWINSGAVNDFRIIKPSAFITQLGHDKSSTKLLRPGTTVLAITGATLGQYSRVEIPTTANQSVIGLEALDSDADEFIYLWIADHISELVSKATGGAQQHINRNDVCEHVMLMPDKPVLKKFAYVVKPLFDQISTLLFQSETLTELRDSLLPRLISGELEIPAELLEA